ncbi:transposase [Paenibacillus sp. BR1-192]|uniref:transposase n=1 Tax=Paenibacillus sp. BR1-192 TaxID=3032287 RepID=UPI00240DB3C0|nr:transposase [Paenibacillus sp. BR1-192]WFB56882.1 transposase [Paenibacillus sp. BR1-192]
MVQERQQALPDSRPEADVKIIVRGCVSRRKYETRHSRRKTSGWRFWTTDLTLTVEEIIRIYAMRWDIEVFFRCTKSLLRLQKEFQCRSYDLLTGHTAIVFCRYILLAWQHRKSTDARSFGGLFYLLCDEVGTLDWVVVLQQLLDLINQVAQKARKKISALIQRHSINGLPLYPVTLRLVWRFYAAKVELECMGDHCKNIAQYIRYGE